VESTTAAKTTETATTPTSAPEATSEIEARLNELRELAATDPVAAQDRTWSWIQELGKRKADDDLGALYKLGRPPRGLDGPTEGILVTPLIQSVADTALRTLTGAWMPWLGKSFDSSASKGYNRLAGSARWPAKLFWPRYGTTPDDGGVRAAFDFETAIEPGKADPDVEVLKIDYGPVESNPRFIIRSIRDELVELVPDTYLGKILYNRGDERYTNIGYFALRQPAG
jgi:hypothetical protein